MKVFDMLILIFLFSALGFGVYTLYQNLPMENREFAPFVAEIPARQPSANYSQSIQFYPNMRYKDRRISYAIESACDEKKRVSAEQAFSILTELTIIEFYPSTTGEIRILCSDVAPEPEERGHFVAGEGGPSEIINASVFSVILSGKISLFRDEKCDTPQIALHEILHSLGFDHNNNPRSIMYPVTDCRQEVDNYIVNEINRLYSIPSEPDLLITKLIANKSGRYLGFEISISNFGLEDTDNSLLRISSEGSIVRDFELQELEVGTRKTLSVQNLRIPSGANEVVFEVIYQGSELDKENNKISASLA